MHALIFKEVLLILTQLHMTMVVISVVSSSETFCQKKKRKWKGFSIVYYELIYGLRLNTFHLQYCTHSEKMHKIWDRFALDSPNMKSIFKKHYLGYCKLRVLTYRHELMTGLLQKIKCKPPSLLNWLRLITQLNLATVVRGFHSPTSA